MVVAQWLHWIFYFKEGLQTFSKRFGQSANELNSLMSLFAVGDSTGHRAACILIILRLPSTKSLPNETVVLKQLYHYLLKVISVHGDDHRSVIPRDLSQLNGILSQNNPIQLQTDSSVLIQFYHQRSLMWQPTVTGHRSDPHLQSNHVQGNHHMLLHCNKCGFAAASHHCFP